MYRVIDKNGLFVRDDFTFDEATEIGLEVEPAQGFYLPKWDGEKWVEGGIAPEPQPIEPTLEERVLTVEQEQEVIINTLAEVVGVTV